MNSTAAEFSDVEKVAAAVLYEGYVLWSYRRSSRKNQQRWTIGGVYPRVFSEANKNSDPWFCQTQCLVAVAAPVVTVKVRFLQIVERRAARLNAEGAREFVDDLQIGAQRYLSWEEATEREIKIENLALAELKSPRRVPIQIPAGSDEELLYDESGAVAGVLVRSRQTLQGEVEIAAELIEPNLFRLTVRVANTAPWDGVNRESALRRTFAALHTILTVQNSKFVSLIDPPKNLTAAAKACENIKTWPVLAGADGERSTLLSSSIILYDYPRIAPESGGDFFDGAEIDQLLLLNMLTLTDDEKAEIRATDPRGQEILERGETLTGGEFMRIHGAIRDFRTLREEPPLAAEVLTAGAPDFPVFIQLHGAAPESVTIRGIEVSKNSRVRLQPRAGGDIMDVALAGKIAIVEGIDQDDEERIHLSVTIEDDPGRELGAARVLGHRFFFAPEEAEPLDEIMLDEAR